MKAGGKIDFDVYLITDSNATGGRVLLDVVAEALKGGIKAIQLREKHLSGKELLELAFKMRRLTDLFGARLFINDRLDVALAVKADGVHMGTTGFNPRDVKGHLAQGMLAGVSTHNIKEAGAAFSDGADFITFGPVYHTASKAKYGAPVGIEKLREAAKAVDMPVFAIGGMGPENVPDVIGAGAYGVAVISSVLAAKDVRVAAVGLLEAVRKAKGHEGASKN